MPSAADFFLAASRLRTAIDQLDSARMPIGGIDDHGVHGGTLQELADRALDEQYDNLDGLGEALTYALEVAEYRRGVCESYARRHAAWRSAIGEWERSVNEFGPGVAGSPPVSPRPPATWVAR